MGDLVSLNQIVPAMPPEVIDVVREVEAWNGQRPQVGIRTSHIFHNGIYRRTVFIPAGVMITGVLMKIATSLILCGDAVVFLGSDWVRYTGYCELCASAGRKQIFVALADTYLTMMFPTKVRTVEEAEREFTDEYDLLASHRDDMNTILITGE
jgi:hypothetical protein